MLFRSASVWLGYYDSSVSLNQYGLNSNSAAAVWGKIMKKAHEGLEVKDIPMPDGIVTEYVCKDSGELPTDLCKNDPRGNRVYKEYFIKGTEPTHLCEAHVKAQINSTNNKLATSSTPDNLTVEKIFVKKDNPNSATGDYVYVLPSALDDYVTPKREENPPDEDSKDEDSKDEDNNNLLDDLLDDLLD